MKDKYIITASIKGDDNKIHTLSVDLPNQTEGSVDDLILFLTYIDDICPKSKNQLCSTGFCVQKYKFDEINYQEMCNMHDPEQFETLYNSIEFENIPGRDVTVPIVKGKYTAE